MFQYFLGLKKAHGFIVFIPLPVSGGYRLFPIVPILTQVGRSRVHRIILQRKDGKPFNCGRGVLLAIRRLCRESEGQALNRESGDISIAFQLGLNTIFLDEYSCDSSTTCNRKALKQIHRFIHPERSGLQRLQPQYFHLLRIHPYLTGGGDCSRLRGNGGRAFQDGCDFPLIVDGRDLGI